MEPILVPGPSKEAFNKKRRMSDLIKAQVAHFKHLEAKLPAEVRRTLPQHAIVSEEDAAKYIAPMTALLLAGKLPAAGLVAVPAQRKVIPIREREGLSIAAGAEDLGPKPVASAPPHGGKS